MLKEVFEACCQFNEKQAKEVMGTLRSSGWTGSSLGAYSFIITTLNTFYGKEHSTAELLGMITDCSFDGGIDGFVFGQASVDIFDCKISANLGLREVQNLESRLTELIFSGSMPVTVGEDWKSLEKHLKKYHSTTNTRGKINIIIVRDSFVSLTKSISAVLDRICKNDGVNVILLSKKDLIDRMLDCKVIDSWPVSKKDSKTLYLEPVSKGSKSKYKALILSIPLIKIVNLYKQYKAQNKNLFDKNIRIPKKSNKFSDGLAYTLKNHSRDFHLFHNGITIVVNDIGADAANYYLSSPQVVNGAQTIDNTFNLDQSGFDKDLMSKSSVICKIVKADPDMISKICETSNTQRAVKVEDLRTNDIFQKELQIYIRNKSNGVYEYSRKGEKVKFKLAKRILYTTFFQWAYAALMKKPAAAKNSRSVIFETGGRGDYEEIQKLIVSNIKQIVTVCDRGVFVGEKIQKLPTSTLLLRNKKGLIRDMNLHIIAGLYLLQQKSSKVIFTDANFNKCFRILKEVFEMERKKDNSLDSGRFFTKSDKAWIYLESKLK